VKIIVSLGSVASGVDGRTSVENEFDMQVLLSSNCGGSRLNRSPKTGRSLEDGGNAADNGLVRCENLVKAAGDFLIDVDYYECPRMISSEAASN
jgi:hypothetical protein